MRKFMLKWNKSTKNKNVNPRLKKPKRSQRRQRIKRQNLANRFSVN